jgi:Tfp pilus assembly major pilin PilA
MITVAIIGLLVAIAIPAFGRYNRRARTTEASLNIRKLYDAAVAYYMTEHASPTGRILARMWPGPLGVSYVPARGSCCKSGMSVKCAPVPSQWMRAPWQELNFSVDDPHLYSYWFSGWQFGNGDTAGEYFQVRAMGDLDCDGTFSLYQRTGTVTATLEISGGAGMYTERELD